MSQMMLALTSPAKPSTGIAIVPSVRVRDGAVYANSRDVADYFGKDHGAEVLRDIRKLLPTLTLLNCSQWFMPSTYQARVGFGMKTLPAYDMTKDGFALLVMGFTGRSSSRLLSTASPRARSSTPSTARSSSLPT